MSLPLETTIFLSLFLGYFLIYAEQSETSPETEARFQQIKSFTLALLMFQPDISEILIYFVWQFAITLKLVCYMFVNGL